KVLSIGRCWGWVICRFTAGYGAFHVSNPLSLNHAHRVSWQIHCGNEPHLCVLHKCDNPACVNPDHLFLATQQDNMADRSAKGRAPSGDKHGTKTKPWTISRGAAHSEIMIKVAARGDRNTARLYPHLLKRGGQTINRNSVFKWLCRYAS